MSFTLDLTPEFELETRQNTCQALLSSTCPGAVGFFIFSRLNIFYLTGTLASGVLWLPAAGKPTLFVRKGMGRALLESPSSQVKSYRSFGDLAVSLAEAGYSNLTKVAAEKNALPWSFAEQLMEKMPETEWVAGDTVLSKSRSIKSEWEVGAMKHAGRSHYIALCEELPKKVRPGMTERDIAIVTWDIFFKLGHPGLMRMAAFGEENFLGNVVAGDSGNYPTYFNGPLGVVGEHPAIPFMGSPHIVWGKNMLLALDTGFSYHGYHTDKTQVYFSGLEKNIPGIARKAHEVCLEIERTAAKALRPGGIPSQIYQISLQMAEEAGFASSFMGIGDNQVPFLGHGIGLTIDEPPVIAYRFDAPLELGMVMAIEPKIGLPGIGMVGSENTYMVTESGGVSLSGVPQDIICIE